MVENSMSKSPNSNKNLLVEKTEKNPVLAYDNGDLRCCLIPEIRGLTCRGMVCRTCTTERDIKRAERGEEGLKKEILDRLCELQPTAFDLQYALAMQARSKDKNSFYSEEE